MNLVRAPPVTTAIGAVAVFFVSLFLGFIYMKHIHTKSKERWALGSGVKLLPGSTSWLLGTSTSQMPDPPAAPSRK